MKKLLTALVITLSTAAMAQQADDTQAQQEQKRNEGRRISTGVDATDVGPAIGNTAKDVGQAVGGSGQAAKEDVSEAARDVKKDTSEAARDVKKDASEVARDVKQDTEKTADKLAQKAGMATASQGTFKKDKAFSTSGTLKNTGGGGVTLVRQGLPDANLDVRQETIVMLDGKKVDSSVIPEGAQVRARFQLEGEEIVAVELNATSPKGVKSKAPVSPSTSQPSTPATQPLPQP
ncbi:hypothetical protein D187_009566 [Cystobacter fuscus DSM 2262]|uniref:TolA protein n=1 Tax=Cystobacter fuscus (strain ATCC 25194 / DSM 2262 / NBRC 100088 / M29) TaxID=1242864 RepID=S9NSH5_CYSF2|nr:hypothetical protein [Cystobacter fuscus]EPX55060.1 hypothetical protein D187_009566 [Cystobacter fuscus DSM 2262]